MHCTQWEKIFDFRPKATVAQVDQGDGRRRFAGDSRPYIALGRNQGDGRRRFADDGRPHFALGRNQGENRKIFALGRNKGENRKIRMITD